MVFPFIAVTKISCQKAPWLWRPTVATAISHMAWRLERKHTRHECQESFPITPAASLFRPSVIIGKPFSLYSTSSLPCGIALMAQFHTHPFLVVILCSSTYNHFISSIVFAASDIFRKGTSCVANAKLGIMDAFQKNLPLCALHIERIFRFRFVFLPSNSFAWRKNIPWASRKASENRENK